MYTQHITIDFNKHGFSLTWELQCRMHYAQWIMLIMFNQVLRYPYLGEWTLSIWNSCSTAQLFIAYLKLVFSACFWLHLHITLYTWPSNHIVHIACFVYTGFFLCSNDTYLINSVPLWRIFLLINMSDLECEPGTWRCTSA